VSEELGMARKNLRKFAELDRQSGSVALNHPSAFVGSTRLDTSRSRRSPWGGRRKGGEPPSPVDPLVALGRGEQQRPWGGRHMVPRVLQLQPGQPGDQQFLGQSGLIEARRLALGRPSTADAASGASTAGSLGGQLRRQMRANATSWGDVIWGNGCPTRAVAHFRRSRRGRNIMDASVC